MNNILHTPVWFNVLQHQSSSSVTHEMPVISFTCMFLGGMGVGGFLNGELSDFIMVISSIFLLLGIIMAIALWLSPYHTKLSIQGLQAVSEAPWSEEVKIILKEKLTRGFLTIHDLNLALTKQAIYQTRYEKNLQDETVKNLIDKF